MQCLQFGHCFRSTFGQLHRLRARLRVRSSRQHLRSVQQGLIYEDSEIIRMRYVQCRKSSDRDQSH